MCREASYRILRQSPKDNEIQRLLWECVIGRKDIDCLLPSFSVASTCGEEIVHVAGDLATQDGESSPRFYMASWAAGRSDKVGTVYL